MILSFVEPLQAYVSRYLRRPWIVQTSRDLADLACHPAAILSDGSFALFARFSDAANGAQQNNWISAESGTVVIDAAVHFGHPEVDLACLDVYQAVPQNVFAGYAEFLPIDPGFAERRSLWRVYEYLGAVTVAGAVYLQPLTAAVQEYLWLPSRTERGRAR